MALSDITGDPMFTRLVSILRLPIPHVLGHYELLLHTAWRTRTLILGDSDSVEEAAMWRGKPEVLTKALRACGRHLKRPGFIEPIFDLRRSFRLAEPPKYITDRVATIQVKTCPACDTVFETTDPRQVHCKDACKSRARRKRMKLGDTDHSVKIRVAEPPHPCRDTDATRIDTDNNTPPTSPTEGKEINTHPQPPQGGVCVGVERLVSEYYRRRNQPVAATTRQSDLDQAGELIELHGNDAWELIPRLAAIVEKKWTVCGTFSGAIKSVYLAEALKALHADRRREKARELADIEKRAHEAFMACEREEVAKLQQAWDELPDPKQAEVRRYVMTENPDAPEAFILRLSLQELASRIRTGRL